MKSRVIRILLVVLCAIVPASAARAATVTYSATQTIPVPPASNFAGSGNGDGWAIALSNTQVFNVHHHNSVLSVACHEQSNAQDCWNPGTRTITDGSGNNFATNGHPGMYLDQATGKLYVYATRSSDSTAGVVCVDTASAAGSSDPFCGFTALTPAGDGPLSPSGISGVSYGMLVGNRWYAFNYVNGAGASGAKNKLLCFDVSTKAACGGQPYTVAFGAGNLSIQGFPEPATAVIGSRLIIPVNPGGTDQLACFDDSTQSSCGGSFPVTLGFSYVAQNGSPFPTLDGSGNITGLCLPTSPLHCYDMSGASMAVPSGMSSVIGSNTAWNGPAFVTGPRIYVPTGNNDTVQCFSFATSKSCPNFPKSFQNLDFLYSVNPDPQRPTCIWVNSDNGASQIQSFDAFTGGACGKGPTRVLAAQFVVPQKQCQPSTYTSIQVLQPPRSSYTDGSIQFADADGNAIPGASPRALDGTGTVDLSDLSLNTSTGLPQFLISLNGGSGAPSQVVVKLTWTGVDDPACVRPGITVVAPTPPPPPPPTVVASRKPAVCGSARKFRIHVQRVRRYHIVKVRIYVNGKRVRVRHRGHSFTAVVNLRQLPTAQYKVLIIATSRNGKVRRGTRHYRTCSAKLKGGRPKL